MGRTFVGLTLLAALLAGCPLEDAVFEPGPANAAIEGGDGQVGPALTRLPRDLGVRVNIPVRTGADPREAAVTFEVVAGGGQLVPSGGGSPAGRLTVNTSGGSAAVGLVLGSPGVHRIRATNNVTDGYLEFQATAHGPAAAVAIDAGDGQVGEVGAELPNRVMVKVTDAAGIQVPGMRVWFIPQDGGRPIDGEVVETGSSGRAQMPSRWRLGPSVGAQRLVARVLAGTTGSTDAPLSGNPIAFTATATAAVAGSVAKNPVSFPVQTAAPGEAVALKPSVLVLSGGGSPMPGVPVRFEIGSGGGHFGGRVVIRETNTDAAGIVTVPDWILGAVGANTVTATVRADGVSGNPVTFSANAVLPEGNLLLNPSFEESVTARVLPSAPGAWGGDYVESVAVPTGFPTVDGARVLRFVATGPTTSSTNTVASEVFQLVDLTHLAGDIDAGRIRIDGEVLFGRVDAPSVDRLFGIQLLAFDGPPDQFATKFAAGAWLGRVRIDRTVTAAATWQGAAGSLTLPANTRYVALHLFAMEDVVNDGVGTPEFAGHYAEAAVLRVRTVSP